MISECERGKVWKNIEINDKAHIICFTRAENAESWKILLTDLVEIWVETLTHETMFDKCQVYFRLFCISSCTNFVCVTFKIYNILIGYESQNCQKLYFIAEILRRTAKLKHYFSTINISKYK